MMTQRNVELQLQVLDVIERRPNNSTSSQEGASSSSINETAKEMAASADEVFNDDVTQEEIEYDFLRLGLSRDVLFFNLY